MPSLRLDWPAFLPHQRRFFDWTSAERFSQQAILGGYGSGKTTAAARKFFRTICEHRWSSQYQPKIVPKAVVMAPTARVLAKTTRPIFESLFPDELVFKRRHTHPMILLANGVEVSFVSGDTQFEGEDLFAMWIDEINHPIFARNPEKYINFCARLRDPLSPKLTMIVSGLPEFGWVRDTFERESPSRLTILAGTRDNPHIPPETISAILAACPAGYEETYIRGGWMSPPDAVFSQWSSSTHLVDRIGNPTKSVHLGIDVGNRGAVVFAQREPDGSVLIVDEMITNDESVEGMCWRIQHDYRWMISRTESLIAVDPTIRRDELNAIRSAFPQVRIVKRERGHELFPVETGVRILQTSLKDAHGDTHLFFTRALSTHKHGVVDAIQTARRRTITQSVVKDNSRDHAMDALRYVVQELRRPSPPQGMVLGPR